MTNRRLVLFGYHAIAIHEGSEIPVKVPKVYIVNSCNVPKVRTSDWIHGRRSDGTDYFTVVGFGLVIVVDDDNVIEIDPAFTEETVPTIDWLWENTRKNEIYPADIPSYVTWGIKIKTKAYQQEMRERKECIEKGYRDKLKEIGVEETTETLELMRLVSGFDHTYEASDDHRYAIATRAKRRELEALLEEKCPKLGAYFKSLLLW